MHHPPKQQQLRTGHSLWRPSLTVSFMANLIDWVLAKWWVQEESVSLEVHLWVPQQGQIMSNHSKYANLWIGQNHCPSEQKLCTCLNQDCDILTINYAAFVYLWVRIWVSPHSAPVTTQTTVAWITQDHMFACTKSFNWCMGALKSNP